VLATIAVLILMVSEIAEAHQIAKTINITTQYIEKLVIIAHSSLHILLAIVYAIILLILVVLDIVVAKEMFKE
jgi:hypothetical protein